MDTKVKSGDTLEKKAEAKMTPILERDFEKVINTLRANYRKPIRTKIDYGEGSRESGLTLGRFEVLLSYPLLDTEQVLGTKKAKELATALSKLLEQGSFRVCLEIGEAIIDLDAYRESDPYLGMFSEMIEVFTSKEFAEFASFLEPSKKNILEMANSRDEKQLSTSVSSTISAIASITGMSNPKVVIELLGEMCKPSFNQGIDAAQSMLDAINYMQLIRIEGESPIPIMESFSKILNSFRYDRLEAEIGDKEKIKQIRRNREIIDINFKKAEVKEE